MVAELIDTSRVEITAKLAEPTGRMSRRGRRSTSWWTPSPDLRLQGTVRSISSAASRQMFERRRDSAEFDIAFDIEGGAGRCGPASAPR